MDELHFDGDPATESTRRKLERVLKEPQTSRWTWLTAAAAGGTAFLWWRHRARKRERADGNGGQGQTG